MDFADIGQCFKQLKFTTKMAQKLDPSLRLYIRLDGYGQAIAGSSVRRRNPPKVGRWLDISDCVDLCGCYTTTTTTSTSTTTTSTSTTTSTTSSTTSTTTTAAP